MEGELKVAFGPVGVAGLVLVGAGLVRRSPLLAVLGGMALWADVRFAELGGFAAARG